MSTCTILTQLTSSVVTKFVNYHLMDMAVKGGGGGLFPIQLMTKYMTSRDLSQHDPNCYFKYSTYFPVMGEKKSVLMFSCMLKSLLKYFK